MEPNGKDANMDDDLTIEKICNFLQDKKEGQYRLYDLIREALEGMVLWLSGLVEC